MRLAVAAVFVCVLCAYEDGYAQPNPIGSAAPSRPLANDPVGAWKTRLVAQLRSGLRYPQNVTNGGEALVSFSMDREGKVTTASLARSSGSGELDAAALALFRDASLPAPPREVEGEVLSLTVPIRFTRR